MQGAFLNWIWSAALKSSWQAGVIVLLALAVRWFFGRRLSPRAQLWIWLLVVVRLALPWTIPSPVSLFNFVNVSWAQKIIAGSRSEPSGKSESEAATSQPAQSLEGNPRSPSTADEASRSVGSSPWLTWAWVAGALTLGLGVAVTHYRLSRRVAKCRPLIDEEVLGLLEDCKEAMGVSVPVTLVETAAVDSPCLFGFVRPRLLLPGGVHATLFAGRIAPCFFA